MIRFRARQWVGAAAAFLSLASCAAKPIPVSTGQADRLSGRAVRRVAAAPYRNRQIQTMACARELGRDPNLAAARSTARRARPTGGSSRLAGSRPDVEMLGHERGAPAAPRDLRLRTIARTDCRLVCGDGRQPDARTGEGNDGGRTSGRRRERQSLKQQTADDQARHHHHGQPGMKSPICPGQSAGRERTRMPRSTRAIAAPTMTRISIQAPSTSSVSD